MPALKASDHLDVDAHTAWAIVSDLSRFDEWLELHEGWRSEVPDELAVGTELTSVVAVKGMRNRVTWSVVELDPPHHIALRGDGKGGTKVALRLGTSAEGSGSRVELEAEFSNPALRGPLGSVASRSLKGELERSLERLAALAG